MRPKEFNRNSVLEKCVVLFWNEGYNATGIEKVVEYTGVNRFSLYDEFENKEGILLASLELYKERYVPFDLLRNSSSVEEGIFQFLHRFFEPTATGHPLGCYITSMAMELRETENMKVFFNNHLDELKQAISQFLERNSNASADERTTISAQLTFFYCTSMAMYIIFSKEETEHYLRNTIKLITACLDK